MPVRLNVVKGPFAGDKIPMPLGKLLIGRAKDCHLRLDSPSVSQHHCVLLLDEYTLRIRDLGSRNGTMVNGRRIGTHESILLHDDTVSIDRLTFQIDLNPAAVGAAIGTSDAPPPSSGNRSCEASPVEFSLAELNDADWDALEATEIFGGDTDHVVPPEVVPTSSPQRPIPAEEPAPVGKSSAEPERTGKPIESAASPPQVATFVSPTMVSPSAAPRKTTDGGGARHGLNPIGQSVVTPKRAAAPKVDSASPTETPSKKSAKETAKPTAKKKANTLRWGLVVVGLIAVAGLGGGAYVLFGRSAPTHYDAPHKYVDFSPESYATQLGCEVPENWKQKFKGGKRAGPIWARFTDGALSIEISEDLTGGGIREAAVAMRRKASRIPSDAPVAEQIHEYQRERTAAAFKSYTEEPRSRGIKTQGLGEARVSNFTATEGILRTEVAGCRATALNQSYQFTVICKCPPALVRDATPVFEQVIASLRSGTVAE